MHVHRGLNVLVATVFTALAGAAAAQTPPVVFVDAGPNWTPATRASFYSQDQGSSMIPYDWLAALKQPNGQAFLAELHKRWGGRWSNPATRRSMVSRGQSSQMVTPLRVRVFTLVSLRKAPPPRAMTP